MNAESGAVAPPANEAAWKQIVLNFQKPSRWRAWWQITDTLGPYLAIWYLMYLSSRLGEKDHSAIVLRFFEGKDLKQVGAALGVSENTAKMRVSRAVEKLRKFLVGRGITLSAAVIAGAVSANSVQAAPPGLAVVVTATAVKGTAVSATLTFLVKATMSSMTWVKLKFAGGVGVAVLLAGGVATVAISQSGGGNPLTPPEIVRRSLTAYAALSSYQSTGKAIEEIEGKTLTASFSIRLGRPGYYLVEYEQHGPGLTNKGAAWCDGSGDYFANDVVNKTNKLPFPGPAHNLGNLWDVSGGVTADVPAMFFGIQIPDASAKGGWSDLVQPAKWDRTRLVKEPDEKAGGTDCHVLSLETDAGKILLWVGKEDFLVHRSQQWVKSRLPEVTDAEMTALLGGVPQPPPLPMEEMKRRINEGRKKAVATMNPATVVFSDDKGSSGLKSMTVQPPAVFVFTQIHENIVVNRKFTPVDFAR